MRSLVFALLAITAVSAGKQVYENEEIEDKPSEVCEPGKSFKHYCNTCFCSDQGSLLGCTLITCPPGFFHKNGSLIEPEGSILRETREIVDEPSEVCEPGKSFKHYCNTCFCSDQGSLLGCTLISCPAGFFNKDGTLREPEGSILRETRELQEKPSEVCEPGKSFKHYCNTCLCSDQGTLIGCTRVGCIPGVYNKDGSLVNPNSRALKQKRESDAYPEGTCTPGESFYHYCNSCICNENGSIVGCTKLPCPPGVFNKDGSLVNPEATFQREKREISEEPKKVCEPGSHFRKYCNSCKCSQDGQTASCTRKFCLPGLFNEDGSLNYPEAVSRQARDTEAKCEPGKAFKLNCNTCICGKSGQPIICTQMGCNVDNVLQKSGKTIKKHSSDVCVPGEAFELGCNTCICGKDGQPLVCTEMACNVDLQKSEKAVIKEQCVPGESFKVDCNRCICGDDGTPLLCTRIDCNPGFLRPERSVNKDRCEPGKRYKKDCNSCICGADGKPFMCTKMLCDPEGFVKPKAAVAFIEDNCEPGSSYKIDCNNCICNSDGKSAGCTKKLCFDN